nr:hypothetical protein [Tanacetum cinerariifolium]
MEKTVHVAYTLSAETLCRRFVCTNIPRTGYGGMGLGQECGRAYKKQWRKPTSTRYSLRSRSDVQSSSDLLLPIVQVPMLLLPLMAIIYRVPLDTQILHPLLLSTPHVLATQPLPASPIVEFQLRAKAKDHAHMVQVGTGVNVRTRNVLRTTHLNRVNANHVNPLAGNNGEGSSSHNEGTELL